MEVLHAVYNHVVLPPRLPGHEDKDIDAVSHDLVLRLIRACETLKSFAEPEPAWAKALQNLRGSLRSCMKINRGRLEKRILLEQFQELQPHHTLILYVVEQNAALIVRRQVNHDQDLVIFEVFEASPPSEQVLAAENALVWEFPGRSVQIPFTNFDEALLDALTTFLEQASMEAIPSLQAQTKKANVAVVEVRDTTDPAMITQMLMPLLEAVGQYAHSPTLKKRVRDDVNYDKAEIPWRRLPFWLVLRVAAQRHLLLNVLDDGGLCYKLLMCIFLAHLLKDSATYLEPGNIIMLRGKLSRRMAKLEMAKEKLTPAGRESFDDLFAHVSTLVQDVIEEVTTHVKNAWVSFKRRTTRRIPVLPTRAPPEALQLSLPNSGKYLEWLLDSRTFATHRSTAADGFPKDLDGAVELGKIFTDRVFRIAAIESRIAQTAIKSQTRSAESCCLQLAKQVDSYLKEVGSMYHLDPLQVSSLVLNLFDLYVQMDACAVEACPLLADHQPVFPPQLLDTLLLSPRMSDMTRLQNIQDHLTSRLSSSQYGHVLSDAEDDNAFPVRFVESSPQMQLLMLRIDDACQTLRRKKEREWALATEEYDRHTERIENDSCVCTWRDNRRDVRGCKKCWHWRTRKRMKIAIHENLLPTHPVPKASVVFELAIPDYISAYRNATWRILKIIEHSGQSGRSPSPNSLLQNCEPLGRFRQSSSDAISLASFKKCFQQTHYKFAKGKIPLEDLLLPFAARFELFDQSTKTWAKDVEVPPTLHHICGVHLPDGLAGFIRPQGMILGPDDDGPSSYEIQANQTECPSNMSAPEFSAYQKLLSGTSRRWENILVELGASNLNFSNSDVMRMIVHLSVLAGPRLKGDTLRTVHVVFKEPAFLECLANQISKRLVSISTNWRETSCMELLINLCLRMLSLSPASMQLRSSSLLRSCRDTTLSWIAVLRKASMDTQEGEVADRLANYAFKAALLSRLTFESFLETKAQLSSEDLFSWVQASVALQDNLVESLEKMPQAIRSMMIRDAKLAYHLEALLHKAVADHPDCIGMGISCCWSDSFDQPHSIVSFSPWKSLDPPHSRWLQASKLEYHGIKPYPVSVHFNIVEGHLMVGGRPRGKLPTEMRNHPDVKALFGNQHLFTYNSPLPQTTHKLTSQIEGQDIYFGMRGGQIVIRAQRRERDGSHRGKTSSLEFVPKRYFYGTEGSFDLPASLVDKCTHWLNLTTGILEIRRDSSWNVRPRDWHLDVRGRHAQRGGKTSLVDPQSEQFRAISQIFQHFVEPKMLTVFQPRNGKLRVEMKHLDLEFYVNDRGILTSLALKAEIDPNQDLGTWYGLESKIVLRDWTDRSKRSVIIPLGKPLCRRLDFHVSVCIEENEENEVYGRFEVDDTLGRLTCAPEQRLLYTKALCHALTSFCLPDPLIKRTGTEEAFHILRSAAAQPWTPIPVPILIVQNLAALVVPQREYYPRNLRRMQRVAWNKDLPENVQHDAYESVIQAIQSKSNMLASFSTSTTPAPNAVETPMLRRRGEYRRRLYERPSLDPSLLTSVDMIYSSRDRRITERARRVYHVSCMIQKSSGFRYSDDKRSLIENLESSDLIGGFHDAVPLPNSISLINQIEDPITMRFGDLVSFCRSATDKASPAFCLGLLAFGPSPSMGLISFLASLSCTESLKCLDPPMDASFADFLSRGLPSLETLEKQITSAYREFEYDPNEHGTTSLKVARTNHQTACEKEGERIARDIRYQLYTFAKFRMKDDYEPDLIDSTMVSKLVGQDWARRLQNMRLAGYINTAQTLFDGLDSPPIEARLYQPRYGPSVAVQRDEARVIPSLSQDLVVKPGPRVGAPSSSLWVANPNTTTLQCKPNLPEIGELETLFNIFKASSNIMRQHYGEDLLKSLEALKGSDKAPQPIYDSIPDQGTIETALQRAQIQVSSQLSSLTDSLAANDDRHKWLQMGDLWPDVGTVGILELLRSRSGHEYGVEMKEALVAFGCAMTRLQQLRRIKTALRRNDERGLVEEMRSKAHENWDPLKIPDWLLLEIESDILIRPDQVDVAMAIIAPASGKNSVLQMNMGEGKTSVIMPMAAALLANGKRLVRLIVPKPLLMQTAQTTQSRLGGLVGREMCHIPFSRQTPTTKDLMELYKGIHMDMFRSSGIMLTSHEHILSFKLSGLQRLADNKLDQSSVMIGFQNWIERSCRDIVDECDFTLAVKTQLNYPSGSEMPVDGHPFRWQVIEELLAMVCHHVPELKQQYPKSFEILGQPGWFPMMQFLQPDVLDEIHNRILDSICCGRAPFLRPAKTVSSQLQAAIRALLGKPQFDGPLLTEIAGLYAQPEAAAKTLLVVRGLITHRILLLCLSKRWNIQYGLREGGHPVAVPYESRGTPSERAEWGHPDVAITFTCLSFYFSGLTNKQFQQGLQHVLTSEDPASQYERWISESSTLPEALHHWNVINVEDEGQMHELWKHLNKTRVVVNYYLNTFVFPVHARQFSVKLQASAWDIPLLPKADNTGAMTTGFSGTKDTLLPLTIQQDDLPNLIRTNAEVLSYLLQGRNRRYKLAADINGKRLSEENLLGKLRDQGIRILIDAGAFIIETSNKDLAQSWLKIDHEAKAAVYFGRDNRAWVMFRDKNKPDAPLLTTPFAKQLEDCVVYLDEAHTRGVDLKFHEEAVAAVTLSLKQTKDFTVQAAMRLRQLKTSQSVVFYAPPEVDGSIRDLCGVSTTFQLDSSHVVRWLLEQTCRAKEDVHGLYISQGQDFCLRQDALARYPDFLTNTTSRERLLGILLEPEHQSLEQVYGISLAEASFKPLGKLHAPQVQAISDELARHGTALSHIHIGALDEVEQEREVELQLESVREVQKPVRYEALEFPGLHGDIVHFARTGKMQPGSPQFEHAFRYIGRTEVGRKYEVRETGSRLFVSREFGRTVALAKGNEKAASNFLRPVEWILWCPLTSTALVIVPEEAEEMLKRLRRGSRGASSLVVHLIAYSAPVTRAMTPFNRFRYYVLPPLPADNEFPEWFKNEVGVLAGRLYLDYSEWSMVERFLGVGGKDSQQQQQQQQEQRGFTDAPADFVLEWLGMRRRAQDVLNTPMGYLCMGRTVSEDHPFFIKGEAETEQVEVSSPWSDSVEDEESDECESDAAWSDDVE